jgi:cell division transport system permease protein
MILFYFAEAIRSIKSAKTSFLLTTISLTIGVLLVLFSFIALQLSDYYSSTLKSNIKINVFLKEEVNEKEHKKILNDLMKRDNIKNVDYVSKEDAAEQFIKETGEDFRKILDYNPLPASFVVRVSEDFVNTDSLNIIVSNLAKIQEVDEVVFREGFIYSLLGYINTAKIYLFIITAVVCFIAIYLVYATVRLIINSRMIEFETMKLVGAKLSTIKIPVFLNGLIAGLLSGILALSIVIVLQDQIKTFETLYNLITKSSLDYLMIIFLTGPILVLLVSLITLRKVSLRI